jgi:hypothetical protein
MIFPDGFKKVGFFENNIFKANLEDYDQSLTFMKSYNIETVQESFKQEIKEYLGIYDNIEDDNDEFIDKEFKKAEKEDPPEETAFKNMQEIINTDANGFNGMTKSDYAA